MSDRENVRRILVLCDGNICRSPYAELRLERSASQLGFEVQSAGFLPAEGRPTPEIVRRVAAARGVDLETHRSRRVSAKAVEWADLIVVMTLRQQERLRYLGPRARERGVCLGAFDAAGDIDIVDPWGRPAAEIAATLERMDRCLDSLIRSLRPQPGANRVEIESYSPGASGEGEPS
jgi:protein-tyrosine phosphatase